VLDKETFENKVAKRLEEKQRPYVDPVSLGNGLRRFPEQVDLSAYGRKLASEILKKKRR
jgi:hypothetical protein